MKTFFYMLALTMVFAACSNTKDTTGKKGSTTFKEGHIVYGMEMEGNPMAAMLGDITLGLYFTERHAKMEMNMGSMMNTTTVVDNKDKKGIVLMSIPMMQKNNASKLDKEYLEKATEDQANQKPTKVEYDPKSKKTIAGYDCYKAIVELANLEEPAIVYITEKLKPNTEGLNMKFANLKGFPLYYEIKQQGMTITMEAKEISTKAPDKSMFSLEIPAEYTEVDIEDLMEGLGGGGGMGF
ncbi:MAG: hypothetical protein GY810_05370 [Aureispira sp.]|nr:hypothetical protein [Aureispira sp.]